MYKILIKNQNSYTFAMEKVDEMETIKVLVDGEETEAQVPNGKSTLIVFERENFDDIKEKYIELLEKYHAKDLNIIQDCTEKVTVDITLEEVEAEPET